MNNHSGAWCVYAISTAFGGSCLRVEADNVDQAITRALMRHTYVDLVDVVRVERDLRTEPWETYTRQTLGPKGIESRVGPRLIGELRSR